MEHGTSYFGVRDLTHVEADLDRFVDAGLDAVLHTYSERDMRFYEGTMAEIVAASHARGLTVYANPWGVGRVFGGEALSEFVGRHPECCQTLNTGERIPAACFNAPAFREYIRDWVDSVVSLGVDVVFWDEPHWFIPRSHEDTYPDDAWGCRCDHCQSRFETEHDQPMPNVETDAVVDFRQSSLLDFLDEMMARVHDQGARNAVCLLPGDDQSHGIGEWASLAKNEHLDTFATDPYWAAFGADAAAFVGEYANRVTDLAAEHDLASQIWIQGFGLDGDPETIQAVRTATRTAIAADVDSIFLWGWDGCRIISDIACEDPDAVWNAYLEELEHADA